jgi:predicted GTPase
MVTRRTTVLTFGGTGHGKSEFLNAYLQREAFVVSDDPKSCTFLTSSSDNVVSHDHRTATDTQGLDDSQGVDASHV